MDLYSDNVELQVFCDLHNVSTVDRFVLNKKYGGQKKTLAKWHDLISPEFNIKSTMFVQNQKEIVESPELTEDMLVNAITQNIKK